MKGEGGNKKPGYFPMFISLEGKSVLIAGAGKIGSRRARILAEFGAEVTVVAPDGCEEMSDLLQWYQTEGKKSAAENTERDHPEQGAYGESTVLTGAGKIFWHQRDFKVSDLEGKLLVIAATSDSSLNDRIVCLCRERGIPANHAGDQNQCDFYFPAIARKDDLVIGITSSRKDHSLVRRFAGRLRQWLEDIF